MKKLLVLLIILTLFLSGCGLCNLNNFILPDDTEFIALIEELDTPEKIGDYMLKNFTYQLHTLYVPNPYQLWLTKNGDCNDFATFGMFIANYHFYETYLIKIFDETSLRHYISVYLENNCFSITDNQYYYFGFKTFKEIVNFDSKYMIPNRKWLKYIVYDYDMNVIEKVIR